MYSFVPFFFCLKDCTTNSSNGGIPQQVERNFGHAQQDIPNSNEHGSNNDEMSDRERNEL